MKQKVKAITNFAPTTNITKARNICRKHGMEMYFKGGNNIKNLLVHPKDTTQNICRKIQRTYAGPSLIHDHHNITGHELSLGNFSIVGREDQSIAMDIKEVILIRVNDPSLNRNIGKYQLPHIWYEVLVKSPELKLK